MTKKIQRKKALDKALNEKLFKLGVSYGKQLRKIAGAKYAQDIALNVAKNIIKLKSAKDADPNKWRYSKNALGFGLDPTTAVVGAIADKVIKNKKPSYLKDALVEGTVGGIGRAGTQMAIGALLGLPLGAVNGMPKLGMAAGAAAPLLAHGTASAVNSLARNKVQKSFPSLSSAQAQGLTSGAFGALGGGAVGHAMSQGDWRGTALGALAGGTIAGLNGLVSRWLANKLYAPMPKSDLGRKSKK